MKKLLITLCLVTMNSSVFAADYRFVLKCDYEGSTKTGNPFYFIGKNNSALIVYVKSTDKIFSYKGGENKSLDILNISNDFYEYKFHQNKTPTYRESNSEYSLDRTSLRLSEVINFKESKEPLYIAYNCVKAKDENSSYNDAISLIKKYENGKFNQI